MSKLERIIHDNSNGLDYILVGEIYLPLIAVPEEKREIGFYGSLHRNYLKDYKSGLYSYGLNYQKTGKELMSQDEIAVMDGSKCIMQLRGVRPFFSDKFDITKHKQYPLLSDYDKKNEFDIEKYVKNRNRLRFKRNDVVDEVCDVGEITA